MEVRKILRTSLLGTGLKDHFNFDNAVNEIIDTISRYKTLALKQKLKGQTCGKCYRTIGMWDSADEGPCPCQQPEPLK